MGRAPCCQKVGLKKGRWTVEEDNILIKFIQDNGEGNWRSMPKNAGLLRCGKSCRLRWINYLRTDLKKGDITPAEEEIIVKLHRSLGNKWSLIAGHLPGRTDNEIKNYWNSHLSRRMVTYRKTSDGTPILYDSPKLIGITKKRGSRSSNKNNNNLHSSTSTSTSTMNKNNNNNNNTSTMNIPMQTKISSPVASTSSPTNSCSSLCIHDHQLPADATEAAGRSWQLHNFPNVTSPSCDHGLFLGFGSCCSHIETSTDQDDALVNLMDQSGLDHEVGSIGYFDFDHHHQSSTVDHQENYASFCQLVRECSGGFDDHDHNSLGSAGTDQAEPIIREYSAIASTVLGSQLQAAASHELIRSTSCSTDNQYSTGGFDDQRPAGHNNNIEILERHENCFVGCPDHQRQLDFGSPLDLGNWSYNNEISTSTAACTDHQDHHQKQQQKQCGISCELIDQCGSSDYWDWYGHDQEDKYCKEVVRREEGEEMLSWLMDGSEEEFNEEEVMVDFQQQQSFVKWLMTEEEEDHEDGQGDQREQQISASS